MLARGKAAAAFEVAQKAAKEAEKVARRQREDEEKAEQKKKKAQGSRASNTLPTPQISAETRKRIQQELREDNSNDESVDQLMEKKRADEKAERKKAEKAERKAERKAEKKAEKKRAKAEQKKSEEKAEAEKKEVEEQIEADKKSTKKVASISDSDAFAASSKIEQAPEKAKPVAPEESTSSNSVVEAQPTTASTEVPSDTNDQDVEQYASDQLHAKDNVDDVSSFKKSVDYLEDVRAICVGQPKLNESQEAHFLELLYTYHMKPFDENEFAPEDLDPHPAKLLSTWIRSKLSSEQLQGNPGESDNEQGQATQSETDQASTSTPATEQTQTEQTQPSTPKVTVNKNGKRPLADETESLDGPRDHRSKRRALSAESFTSPRKQDAHSHSRASSVGDNATLSSTQKPVTVDSSAIKAGAIPAVNGDMIPFGATPDAAATYAHIEAQVAATSAAHLSEQSPQQQGKKRTAMDAGMQQPISPAPTKKSKLSEEESALITQAGHATEQSQAEANITKPQEVVPKPETASDSIEASPVPAAHDAPKEEDSSATKSHAAEEKSSDAKSSEDSKKSPATKQSVGKAKSTTNTSATSAETQPKKAANNDNADNSIVKPSVAKEAAVVAPVSSRANNSDNRNSAGKVRPAAQKSTSKSSTMATEKQQQKKSTTTTTTTMSKQSATKRVPTALDAKNNAAATKKQSSVAPAPPKRKGPSANRFVPSTPEETRQRLAQHNSQPPAPQSAPSAVKKVLVDKTNTQRKPQRQRAPASATTTTKKQLDTATEKPAPQRSTAQKKRSLEADEVITPVSKSAKKQHTNPSPSVPAKATEKKGKRARDEDDEPETSIKTAKKQRTDESPPPRERASRSRTAADAARKPAVATQPRRQAQFFDDIPESGDEESDVEPKPKNAKAKTTSTVEEAKDEQTVPAAPAATTTTTPSAATNTQQAPTDNIAAGPPRQRGVARSTNAQPRPARSTVPTAASIDAKNKNKLIK
jgi:hypothetical protein